MKFIFTVHSHITFLASIGVILKENYRKEDVLIYCNNYKPPITDYKIIKSFKYKNIFERITNFNFPVFFDKKINEITSGENFICYFDLMSFDQRLFATNYKCVSFNFIEEGTTCLSKGDNLQTYSIIYRNEPLRINSFTNIKSIIFLIIKALKGYNSRLISIPFNPNNYISHSNVKFYCFTKNSFYYVPKEKKQILSFTDVAQCFRVQSKLENEIIWIEDSFVASYGLDEKQEIYAIEKFLIRMISKNILQSQKIIIFSRKKMIFDTNILILFKKYNFEYEILNDKTPKELILLNSKRLILLGNVSALLYYGAVMGHKSYSYFELLKSKPNTSYDEMDSFWETVRKI